MKTRETIRDLALLAMFAALIFVSKNVMEFLPNVHPVTMFVMVLTFSYRWRALIPIYIFVFMIGVQHGFPLWWIPYLYIWTVYWAVTMLIPYQKIPMKARLILLPVLCGFFGLAYGTLYAPAQALMFHLNFKQTLAWIAAGLPWDAVHFFGNLSIGTLVVPLTELVLKMKKKYTA